MNPPLRSKDHCKRLWNAVDESLVSTIGSDHAPHTKEEKNRNILYHHLECQECKLLLPIMLDHVNKEKLKIENLIKLVCENPCDLFGIKNKGYIKENFDADLTVIDMNKEVVIKDDWIENKCGWTPF